MFRRLIASRYIAETDAKAVPRVNRRDDLLIDLVGHMVERDQCELLRPEEGGTLAFAKERRLPPDGQRVEALLRFAPRAHPGYAYPHNTRTR